MKGSMHLIGGVSVGIATAYLLTKDVTSTAVCGMIGGIGGLFPDIDSPTSMISKNIPLVPKAINKAFGHRTFTHSLMIPIFIGGIAYLCRNNKNAFLGLICFGIGFLMHLIQDTLTKGGVPWLYPLKRKRFSLLPIRSGNPIEIVFTIILIGIYVGGLSYVLTGSFVPKDLGML